MLGGFGSLHWVGWSEGEKAISLAAVEVRRGVWEGDAALPLVVTAGCCLASGHSHHLFPLH